MVDCARCLEKRSNYRNFIDFVAARGATILLWHFTDDQGCALQFDSIPQLASPNAYSKTEMHELVAYAAQRGVQIVPELASLGHCRYITRLPQFRHLDEADDHFTGMCPVADETRRILRVLIEETAEVFSSTNFHVGLDEVNIGGHPLTKIALQKQTRGDLLADYATFIHGVVTGLGKCMWMWGDGLLLHPEMMQRLPRDIVVCNWQYRPDAAPHTTQALLDAGFDVMLCSALISHDQPLFPGERFSLPNIRSLDTHRSFTGHGHVLGHLNTVWTPVRYIADSLWVGIDLAAAVLRDGEHADETAQLAAFGETFYGLNGEQSTEFVEAAQRLITHSPMRKEWLGVVKLEPLSTAALARVRESAIAFAGAHDRLLRIAPAVRQHKTEFGAFVLLFDMLAHTYAIAAEVPGINTPVIIIERWIHDAEALLDRVDRAWDRERFADDSRKYVAPIASFQNDHLVPLIQKHVLILKEIADAIRVGSTDMATAH